MRRPEVDVQISCNEILLALTENAQLQNHMVYLLFDQLKDVADGFGDLGGLIVLIKDGDADEPVGEGALFVVMIDFKAAVIGGENFNRIAFKGL